MTRNRKIMAILFVIAIIGSMFCTMAFAAGEAVESSVVTVEVDGEAVEYDLADGDSAHEYVDSYADNLTNDKNFKTNIATSPVTKAAIKS